MLVFWFIVWTLLWGTAGYVTVGAIMKWINKRRFMKAMAAMDVGNRAYMRMTCGRNNEGEFIYDPFKGILR